MYRGGLIWVYAYRQQNALCQQAVRILHFKTAEILITLRFSHFYFHTLQETLFDIELIGWN